MPGMEASPALRGIAGGFMRFCGRRRIRESALILAVAPVIASLGTEPHAAQAAAANPVVRTNLIQVRAIHPNPAFGGSALSSNITAYPLNAPPINGFTPWVVFGMTDEFNNDDF